MHKSHLLRTRFVSLVLIFVLSILLSACGGGGGEEDNNNNNTNTGTEDTTIVRELSGTAAVGAPVAGTITIIDSDGNIIMTQSDTDGTYTVNLEGRRGPYLIRLDPDNDNLPVMYSYATGSGIANITPFTSLALFLAYQTNLETAYINWDSTASTWQYSQLEQALAKINANFETDLLNAAVDPKRYDLFTASFSADGTGIDAFYANYSVTIDFTNTSYEITDSSGQAVTFNESVDTTGYYIGAVFLPDDTAQWQLTYSYTVNINGTENTITQQYTIPTNNVPWNKNRFNDLFWNDLPATSSQTYTCPEDPRIDCEYTWTVNRLEANYEVIGTGDVGTEVNGSAAYSWSLTGFTQYTGQPRQEFDYFYSWEFTWSWKRVS